MSTGRKPKPKVKPSAGQVQLWTKAPFTNLVRYEPSGVYFARVRVQGKLVRRSLNTTVLSVAKLRLGDFEKSQRQAAESQTEAKQGKMPFSEALKILRSRIEGDVSLKPRSRSYYEQRIVALLKSWPVLEQKDVRTISKSDCLDWASHFARETCATAFNSDAPSSGSAKIDAYRWARARYLKAGQCAPALAAYYLDAFWLQHPRRAGAEMHTLSNHDYFVARRAFFFDLSPWGDERPGDDPGQPLGADKQEFLAVLRALYDYAGGAIIKVGGFTPWPYKYTSHAQPPGKYDGVPTEWEFGRLISQFNGYMEADAAGLGGMANASFFAHYPLASRYLQPNPKPGLADWRARGYVTPEGKVANRLFVGHYVGDYDAPSWLYKAVPKFFQDPARGQVPLGWAFDPNLADRVPQALVYAYRNATTNDFFIAGDSGAGYLNPRALTARPVSGLPSGLDAWAQHCRRYYERWGMSITGFMLDGSGGKATEAEFQAYRPFSPDGIGTHFEPGPALHAGIPTCVERDLPDDPAKAVASILAAARGRGDAPGFFWARSILRSPSWYAQISRQLAEQHPEAGVTVVDPYTFFGLIRLRLSGPK